MSELESLKPACTAQVYLEARQDELVDWVLKSHKYRLRTFVERYEESGVDDLTELDDQDLYEFHVWRHEGNFGVEGGEAPEEIMPITLRSQLATLQTFLRFTANIHTVSEDLYERVPLLKLPRMDDISGSTLEPNRTTDIFKYLHRYYYAS